MNESSINTRCPACHTAFNVTNGQLKVADGLVRCGGCLHVFNALQSSDNSLAEKKDTPKDATLAPTPAIIEKTTRAPSPERSQQQPLQPQTKQPTQEPIQQLTQPLTPQHSIQLPAHENDLDLIEDTFAESSLSRHITNFLIISLVAFCIAQILWFQKDNWIQEDQFRPIYQAVYTLIDQPLPAKRAPDLIINKQFIIQPHEELADAIRISILLENSAAFSQPFPTLQLIFTDIKGHTTAQRTLPASEYINTQLFPYQLMPSKQPIQIQLDMMAPGHRAVGYQLNLISG